MKGEAQGYRRQAENNQAGYDNPAAAEPIQQLAHKGLGQAVDHKAQGRRRGDGAAIPVKFLAHGQDKDAEAVARPVGDKSHENAGGNDVPAVENPGPRGPIRRHRPRPLLQGRLELVEPVGNHRPRPFPRMLPIIYPIVKNSNTPAASIPGAICLCRATCNRPLPSFPRKREYRGGLPILRHYTAVPWGFPLTRE